MATPSITASVTCLDCGASGQGIYNQKMGRWQCKECFWTDVVGGNTNLDDEAEMTCSECGDTDTYMYCSNCYESNSDRPNACDNCGNDSDSVYCSDCHDGPGCDSCGREASSHYCSTHENLVYCRGCSTTKDGDEMRCGECSGTATNAIVSDDGSSISVDGVDIAWVN